jgi:hypothetical protein
VAPARERAARARLFDALEATLPVRFIEYEAGRGNADAVLALPGAEPMLEGLPCLVAMSDEGAASPMSGIGEPVTNSGPELRLTASASIDARLRGVRLRDEAVSHADAIATEGATVLAARDDGAVWVRRGNRETVSIAPLELEDGETLRERIRDGRFLALTALIHFARTVCGSSGWVSPPVRACFLFDDPNLHRPTYGYVRYHDLVREADHHDYHVAFAMVPLDGWFTHRATAALFRERSDRLSLVIHGNNHTYRELAQPASSDEWRALLAQALRRVERVERRSGVSVGRIMVAPHGDCSRELAHELIPLGFEALCISRPYPWLAQRPLPWLTHPPESSALTGLEPASIVDNGLPVLLRHAFSESIDDLALRAFLDQPLILYGHHADIADGLERLSALADQIRGLGHVEWMSLSDVAAGNFRTSVDGDVLHVRMFTRRARLRVPAGTNSLVVEAPVLEQQHQRDDFECDGRITASDQAVALPGDPREIEIRLVRDGAVVPHAVPAPGMHLWPIARRLMSEGRDRFTPFYHSVAKRGRRPERLSLSVHARPAAGRTRPADGRDGA